MIPVDSHLNHVPPSSTSSATQTVARVQSLSKVYGKADSNVEVHALRDIDLNFDHGEYVAICGASGSGKSTLMNILGCLDIPTTGRYWLGGNDVSELTDDELSEFRGQHLGFVFQSFNLIPQLSVLENVEVPLFYQGLHSADRVRKAGELIEMVGLSDRRLHRPNELSGGEQQRVAIARALINDPLIVLADEPTGNLDSATGETVMAIFDRLNSQGTTIVMVTHERHIAAHCERTITLRDGRILSDEQSN